MRIQPIFYSYSPLKTIQNNKNLGFKAQNDSENDTFEPQEKKLSPKEQNELLMKNYYRDLLMGMGLFPKTLPNGKLKIQNYKSSDITPSLDFFTIKEENLFKYIEEISGKADFKRSKMKNLGALKRVGHLCLQKSDIEDLSGLKEVSGNIYLNNRVKSLNNIKIGGVVHLGVDSKVSTKKLDERHIDYYKHNYPLK